MSVESLHVFAVNGVSVGCFTQILKGAEFHKTEFGC